MSVSPIPIEKVLEKSIRIPLENDENIEGMDSGPMVQVASENDDMKNKTFSDGFILPGQTAENVVLIDSNNIQNETCGMTPALIENRINEMEGFQSALRDLCDDGANLKSAKEVLEHYDSDYNNHKLSVHLTRNSRKEELNNDSSSINLPNVFYDIMENKPDSCSKEQEKEHPHQYPRYMQRLSQLSTEFPSMAKILNMKLDNNSLRHFFKILFGNRSLERYHDWQLVRYKMNAFLDGRAVTMFFISVTIVVVFVGDLIAWLAPIEADDPLGWIYFTAFVLFSFEFIVNMLFKRDYNFQLYFWLDLVATASLILEIHIFSVNLGNSDSTVSTVRAGRAARAGSRASRLIRMVRVIRLLRLVRITKFLKYFFNSQRRLEATLHSNEYSFDDSASETKHVKSLSELTTKKVVVATLLLLICLPFFDVTEINRTHDYGMEELLSFHRFKMSNSSFFSERVRVFLEMNDDFTSKVDHDRNGRCVWLAFYWISEPVIYDTKRLSSLRTVEIIKADVIEIGIDGEELKSVAWFDQSQTVRFQAMMDLCKTVFVVLVLVILTVLFTRDANHLVIAPMLRITNLICNLDANPFCFSHGNDVAPISETYSDETNYIIKVISKISVMMQLAFGCGGTNIVQKTLVSGHFSGLEPGQYVLVVYGCTNIHQFSKVAKCLKQNIIIFINTIAALVHKVVNTSGGTMTRNTADTFLYVWKVREIEDIYDESTSTLINEDLNFADNALNSTLCLNLKVLSSEPFQQFSRNSYVRRYIPEFSVKLRTALDMGSAIEGVIGSNYKIDTSYSYVSPRLNVLENLQKALCYYNVDIIMSGEFVKYLSNPLKKHCRKIDIVQFNDGIIVELWTYDLYLPDLSDLPRVWLDRFSIALDAYLLGDWSKSKVLFEECLVCHPKDGPTLKLHDYMARYDFKAPLDWCSPRRF